MHLHPSVGSRIAGTGSYLPPWRVDNAALGSLIGRSPESITESTGIASRHFAVVDEAASDLGLNASVDALAGAGSHASDVDCVIFATHTPDFYSPGSGCVLAAKLGLVGVPALDVRNQCSGFLYGLSVADHFVRLGTYRHILVVDAEVMSRTIELSPRGQEAAMVYADAAGAAVVVPDSEESRGILGIGLHADGRFARASMIPLPGSHHHRPLTASDLQAGGHLLVVDSVELMREGHRHVVEAVAEALEGCGLTLDEIALVIPTQSAACIESLLARPLRIPRERLWLNRYTCGDTTGAALPLGLDEAFRSRRVGPGDAVLLLSFGAGFTWAWAVVRL